MNCCPGIWRRNFNPAASLPDPQDVVYRTLTLRKLHLALEHQIVGILGQPRTTSRRVSSIRAFPGSTLISEPVAISRATAARRCLHWVAEPGLTAR
jgi:hypothetical protein